MQKVDVSAEYAEQLKKFMSHYGLYDIDISFLAKTNKNTISGILTHTKSVRLKTLESIANIFGFRYFQFGNPDCVLPEYEDLPNSTKERILKRKKEGPPSEVKYNNPDLNKHILNALSQYSMGDKFTSSMIHAQLPKRLRESIKPNRITDRFSRTLSIYVEKTGEEHKDGNKRGTNEEYYRLIKEVQKK